MPGRRPVILAFTQGDPAGIGPEILLKLLAHLPPGVDWRPLLVAERVALEAIRGVLPQVPWKPLHFLPTPPARSQVDTLAEGTVPVLDPVGKRREIRPGVSSPADAAGALTALDAAVDLVRRGVADALITGPVSKASIARHAVPGFRGHTEYLAAACGLERYGRDYLMTFLAEDLQVALLTVHLPLKEAVARVRQDAILEALTCLHRHAGGRIGVAGLNPHAGEDGILGDEDREEVAPAVSLAREQGIDARGPESPDTLFARARQRAFDWVLALYHDQGLIPVKTVAFGLATNWTLGLPFLRTSVDHGTAFDIAGRGMADVRPLAQVVETTLRLLRGELPRGACGVRTPPARSAPPESS